MSASTSPETPLPQPTSRSRRGPPSARGGEGRRACVSCRTRILHRRRQATSFPATASRWRALSRRAALPEAGSATRLAAAPTARPLDRLVSPGSPAHACCSYICAEPAGEGGQCCCSSRSPQAPPGPAGRLQLVVLGAKSLCSLRGLILVVVQLRRPGQLRPAFSAHALAAASPSRLAIPPACALTQL